MQSTKYQRMKETFQAALANDNLEECFNLLRTGFILNDKQRQEIGLLEGRYNRVRRERRGNLIDFEKFSMETSHVANGLNELLAELKEDAVSISEEIPNRILVVACKKSPTDWENLFPEAFFSHVHIMRYGEEAPAAYASPDIVVFDDLDCPGIGNDAQIRMLARSMPHAHFLYYGLPGENLFKKKDASEEDKTFALCCADANSKFTLHARLRELLEFRKIYGPPAPTTA